MNKTKKKLVAGMLGLCLTSGTIGVYAGTVLESYKTPRGNIATVEPVNVHKQRIALKVNGTPISKTTWYANDTTYVPMRDVAELLGASVNYDPKTMSADIVTKSKLLDLLGLKMNVPYYGKLTRQPMFSSPYDVDFEFKITTFNPTTNTFEGVVTYNSDTRKVSGKISESGIVLSEEHSSKYELKYNGNENKFVGEHAGYPAYFLVK